MSRTIVLDGSVSNERFEDEYNHIVDSMVAKYQAGEDDSFESAKINIISRRINEDIWVFEHDPDKNAAEEEDDDDSWMEVVFDALGYRPYLMDVLDHITSKAKDTRKLSIIKDSPPIQINNTTI